MAKRINNVEKNSENKPTSQTDDKPNDKKDTKPHEADKDKFPPIRKSFSIMMNKPKGNVVQTDPEMFINNSMNDARVVTSKRKRCFNYRF